MKNLLFLFSLIIISSCSDKVIKIGSFNMVSTRNIDSSIKYAKLADCINCDMKTAKRNTAATLEDAVDIALNYVPNSEYMMNARIYLINGRYVVQGDVWGISGATETRVFSDKKKVIVTQDNLEKRMDKDVKKEVIKENIEIQEKKQEPITSETDVKFKRGDNVIFKIDNEYYTGVIKNIFEPKKIALISYYKSVLSLKEYKIEVPLSELSKK